MVRILIADDSARARHALRAIVHATEDMRVVAEASNGQQAVAMARDLRPDVIVMDIHMPGMDGLAATKEIMYCAPTPIVMVTSNVDQHQGHVASQALRLGALSILPKPVSVRDPQYSAQAKDLIRTLRSMAEVQVIHHWQRRGYKQEEQEKITYHAPGFTVPQITSGLVAMVASTGGPTAIATILRRLPESFELPIVIVQHLAHDFLPSLVRWLNTVIHLPVTIARPGESPEPGHVYLAPGEANLYLTSRRRFALETDAISNYAPSGDVLLESVAEHWKENAVGIILTGMGRDGVRGLHLMRRAGAITIAQDQASSVVFGMPGEAIATGAAQHVLPLSAIPDVLVQLHEGEGILQ